MKKQLMRIFSVVLGLALLAVPGFAQTLLVTTTLAAAVSNSRTTSINLTAITGLTAGSSAIYVDQELIFVNTVPASGTIVSGTRGYGGTIGATHNSGALVFLVPTNALSKALVNTNPQGSCTRTNLLYLPVINTRSQQIGDCIGGQWTFGIGGAGTFFGIPLPTTGATAYSSTGTDTAIAAATSMYCTEIDVPFSKYLTGLAVLNGATVGTDNHLVILYDGTGNKLANSATAGALSAGANSYQKMNFVTPYYAVGPAKYYACLQSNGTTASVRMTATGIADTYTTKAVTGQTFGTIAATFTVPTTFTTVVGPFWELY